MTGGSWPSWIWRRVTRIHVPSTRPAPPTSAPWRRTWGTSAPTASSWATWSSSCAEPDAPGSSRQRTTASRADRADVVAIDLGEPQVAVGARSDAVGVAPFGGDADLGEHPRGGDPADLVPDGLDEPERALAGGDTDGPAVRRRDGE